MQHLLKSLLSYTPVSLVVKAVGGLVLRYRLERMNARP